MRRSMLFLPGNNPNMIINAGCLGSDAVIFDLEDADAIDKMAKYIKAAGADAIVLVTVGEVDAAFDFNSTTSDALDGTDYASTDYTLSDERLVLVTYEKLDGSRVSFVLNYNIFDVTVKLNGKTYTIGSYDYATVNGETTK